MRLDLGQHGLEADLVDTIALGAELHDVGKIGVSESVLHKAGKLTDAEYRHIMEHTLIGARILGPLMKDAPGALSIVRSHHERLDGTGSPDGLKGDRIPFEARLVSVADAFDAMTSVRPYRPSLSVKHAMRELEEFYIRTALRRTRGNRTRAAEILEISQRALLYKIKEYAIDADAEGERM